MQEQRTQRQIKFHQLNKRLGNNELREYLSNKQETSNEKIIFDSEPDLWDYREPLDHNPRVLLIGPCITIPHHMQKRCIPPLGLSYIAAFLEQHGYEVDILDCYVEGYEIERHNGNLVTYGLPPEMLYKRLRNYNPDIIGVSILFSTDLYNVFEICQVAKKLFLDVPLVVGGLHATIYPRDIFRLDVEINHGKRCVDWVIRGEGEYRLFDFIELLRVGKVNRKADGLVGFIGGEFFCNHQVATIENLDVLPFPAYHLLPMEKYFEINIPFAPAPIGDRVCQILTFRGCPIGCTFCANTNMYSQFRVRSIGNVIEEIEHLKMLFNIDELQFADDNLTLKRDHTIDLMNGLKKVGLPWCTANGTMINTLHPELLELMRDSGLYQITLSLDSGSARTLKNLHHKPVNLSKIPDLIAKCKELGIWIHGTLVVGMPNETLDAIKEGFNFVMNELELTSISTFIAQPIPGSELFHQALNKGSTFVQP